MGCISSKVDDLPAVALCRDRCHFLEEAIRQRYALAEAHVAYIHSLKEIGLSLDRFFSQDLDYSTTTATSLPSPVLPLPTQRKGDPVPVVAPSGPPHVVSYHSHSNSGSHLNFHSGSDDDDDDDDSGSLHHSDNSSPLHYHHQEHETLGSIPPGFMTMNYMKKRSTPSVVHQQRPMNPETQQMGESSSYSYFNYQNPENHPNTYPYNSYSNYGFYGSPPQYSSAASPPPNRPAMAQDSASSSKPPPPPPSPPRASAWDFFNPFETVEKYYPSNTNTNTPSRNSKEVRDEEGIPDLEDDNYQDEVVKEVYGDQKFNDGGGNYSKMTAVPPDERDTVRDAIYEPRPSRSVENNNGVEYEVHLVDKNVVANDERSNVPGFKARGGSRGAYEVIREIKAQFDRAAESGNEVSKMLEVGKVQYPRKNAVYQVSSKMLHSVTPSLSVVSSQPSTSTSTESSSSAEKSDSIFLDFDQDVGMMSGNLSSTLQKLLIWEKKLYDEVKAEEKMRIFHERKSRRLKRLDEKGAEAHKVDSTRTLVRNLSTKIRIAIQVVDKISIKISKLRDEELWPQINELIIGLIKMWKVMLECHRNQCQAIAEAKNLDVIASNRKISDAHLNVIKQLECELLRSISNFCSWIGAQKGYIKALNSWLLKCLLYEPEETPDGIVPFSPGRIGAPPVFVICNQWSQAMDRISEKEVVDSMRGFAVSVHQLWERHNLERCQMMVATKDAEINVKAFERDRQKMQKEWQALDKKIVVVSGQGGGGFSIPGQLVHPSDTTNSISLQLGMKHVFEAMERFTANSMQVYEELIICSEQDRLARENTKVP